SLSAPSASRLWEIIEAAVVNPPAAAVNAANATEIMSQASHAEPDNPRTMEDDSSLALAVFCASSAIALEVITAW
ncbi:hypothetical protein L0M97_14105, partial [[Ruminococcus] torques]|uniref:hypothetical protein n=1 Tax=[Ruminococcus] torques TaxID=33039 RepID=UPI001EDFF962